MQTATTVEIFPSKEIKQKEKIKRVFDFLAYQENVEPKPDCIASKVNGQWRKYSTQKVRKNADAVSLGLIDLGVKKGDVVAIISENRPEWNFCDLGTIQLGAVVVPLYPNASSNDFEYILEHAEVKVLFVSQKMFLDKVLKVKDNLPNLQTIYTFEKVEGFDYFGDLIQANSNKDTGIIETYRQQVYPEDLMTLMYTSGTTGTPKGVMISHDNLVFNIFGTIDLNLIQKTPDGDMRALSFLPLCHVFEKSVFYSYLFQSISVYYAESLETIAANMQEIKPHGFTTVPRLLEKVYEKIEAKAAELTGIKKMIFDWAMSVARQYTNEDEVSGWYGFQLGIARKLVFKKWQEALGGNVQFVISGAAALQPRLAQMFWAAGIPILEGYGQSESTPSGSINYFGKGNCKIGTVGKVIPGIEMRIEAMDGYRKGEGEILMRGRNIMKGYYKKPDVTAETVVDGWLHTGDIGIFVDGRGNLIPLDSDQIVTSKNPYFLKITDRKKEIFKTSGGKYIAPLQLETKFKESHFIEQMCVFGENEKFPSALIVPSFESLKKWCEEHHIKYTNNVDMVGNAAVIELFQKEVDKYNEPFGNYERIKKFALLPVEWTSDSGELTPTQKMKRRVIQENYRDIIEDFYKE
ncbi:MAG: long-chain fatty acid--CoA ligase [Microscillaceae bacterium]|nr:long-chain fatty acid--CoA ligase [Microscillaceae bacterium]